MISNQPSSGLELLLLVRILVSLVVGVDFLRVEAPDSFSRLQVVLIGEPHLRISNARLVLA